MANPDIQPDPTGRRLQPIDIFFAPKAVAVIGASEAAGSVGRALLWNLVSSPFGGMVFPVGAGQPSVLGIKAYPTLAAVPDPVDLAIICTPAPLVMDVIGECVAAGVRGAIIISDGFRESGASGLALEQRVLAQARRGNMRLIGPNCLGLMRPQRGLNAALASSIARPGQVAFISQSGALGTAILDWSLREHVGLSAFVSVGAMLDVGWGELIDYFGQDAQTKSIVIYMEAIGDARAFLSAAREVSLSKPIIVLKGGRSEAAARAAASHTGALVGSDEVLHAAFRRSGVLRVGSIADLFDMADLLAKQPRPAGPRLTILSNAGGPAVLATDELIACGGALAPLSPETLAALDKVLPPQWSHANPIDILGDADPARYGAAAEIAARNPESDGLLVILTPQALTDPAQTAARLQALATRKPMLASWMGGARVDEGEALLNRANIPTFLYPDTAARAFHSMWRYSYNLRGLYETPILPEASDQVSAQRAAAERHIQGARAAGRTQLNEVETKQLLAAYGIPTVETRAAHSEAEALEIAESLGYPLALKLLSETIAHKSEVGGVRLHLQDSSAVQRAYRALQAEVAARAGPEHFQGVSLQPMLGDPNGADPSYELIVGSSPDPQFGPVLLFGAGGRLVELLSDHALGLPPLTTTLARRLIERTRVFQALRGARGRAPIDLAALEQLLVRFSQLVVEQRWIREIEINPLLISGQQLVALDARATMYGMEVDEQSLPRPAIRPYPSQYAQPYCMKNGDQVTIRPIRPEDEPLIVAFHSTLSEQSVYLRYFYAISLEQRIAHERLTRICFVDYDRAMVLVVERTDAGGQRAIIGVGRLVKLPGTSAAEFAAVVSDAYQGQGLGGELLRRLIAIGRDERLERIVAEVLPDNRDMQRLFQKLGFRFRRSLGEPTRVELDL